MPWSRIVCARDEMVRTCVSNECGVQTSIDTDLALIVERLAGVARLLAPRLLRTRGRFQLVVTS